MKGKEGEGDSKLILRTKNALLSSDQRKKKKKKKEIKILGD